MTAEYDPEREELNLSDTEEPVEPVVPARRTPLGKSPAVCTHCQKTLYVSDLTACPICGLSSLVSAAHVCYAESCEKHEQDIRWKSQKQTGNFETGCFKVTCQPNPTPSTPKPRHLTAVLSVVTCPKCLHALGMELDEFGSLMN